MEERIQRRRHVLKSLSVFVYSYEKECVPSAHLHIMSNRIPVRTILSPSGICRAYNDFTIEWMNNSNNLYSIKINSLATVLLGVKGPQNEIESIFVGCEHGDVHHFSIPNLVLLNSFHLDGETIRSMTRLNASSRNVLIGTQSGAIWLAGVKVPNKTMKIFETHQPITSLQVERDHVYVQSGWTQTSHYLNGEDMRSQVVKA